METSGLAPSRAWYMLAMILLVVAAAVAAGALLKSIRQINFKPIMIPGETDINVMTPGTWLVCIESTDGSSPVANYDMHIEFLDPATGESLPMRQRSFPLDYQLGSRRGSSVGDVTFPRTGRWIVTGSLAAGAASGEVDTEYVVGPDPVGSVMWTMLISGIITVVLCSLALGTWCLVFLLRWRNRGTA
jgi:hypothetical protein